MSRRALVAHPSAELYGSDRVMVETVEGLRESGWDVTVTVPSDGPLVADLRARGVAVVLCPSPVLRKRYLSPSGLLQLAVLAARSSWEARRLLRQVQPDVVYVSTLTIPLWSAVARSRRIPVLCHVHEAEASASPLLRRALALPLLLAQRVAVNSRFSLGVLTREVPSLASRSVVVYNGVAGPPTVTDPRTELVAPVRLLYMGRLSVRKGVDVAVSALAALVERGVDARLDILGAPFPGYEWVERDLRVQAARAGIADRVAFLGFSNDVWPHVAAADIVLVPSRQDEPFGNTAVEGVLAARPVLASASSGLLEAIDGFGSARGVDPGDAAALAAAVQDVLDDWPEVRPLAIRDAASAAERYAPRTYRSAIAEVVSETAARPSSVAAVSSA